MSRSRMHRRGLAWGAAALLVAGVAVPAAAYASDSGQSVAHTPKSKQAKNVILLIGDGMGDSEITLARDYTVGAAGRLNMDKFPSTGAYTTYAVDKNGKPDYVTDSAASGTGWATGHKTVNGRISKTPGTDKPLPTILELAQKNGLATGSVTTAELTDATPAVLASHVGDRSCQGPADMKKCSADTLRNGGLGSIAEQSVNHKVDVLLGGGKARFDQTITEGPYKGKTVTEQARKLGYQIVTDDKGLSAVKPGKPVLGLFAPGNVPVEWTGKPAAVGGTDPQRCTTGNAERPAGTPAWRTRPARPSPCWRPSRARSTATARASSSRSRAPRSTSRTTPPTRAARSVRPPPSTAPSRSPATTPPSTPTPSWSPPPTTATPARSCRWRPPRPASPRLSSPTRAGS